MERDSHKRYGMIPVHLGQVSMGKNKRPLDFDLLTKNCSWIEYVVDQGYEITHESYISVQTRETVYKFAAWMTPQQKTLFHLKFSEQMKNLA